MRNKLLTLLGCAIACFVQAYAQENSYYYAYTYGQFMELHEVQQPIDPKNIDCTLLQAAMFHETNYVRQQHGLPPMSHSAALERAAADHTHDMTKFNFFSHRSKVKGKERITDRLKLVGLNNVAAAENIAISFLLELEDSQPYYPPSQNGGYFSLSWKGEPIPYKTYSAAARNILEQWMQSQGHRQNILNPRYAYLGCGASLQKPKDPDEVPMFYGTQLFTNSVGTDTPSGG